MFRQVFWLSPPAGPPSHPAQPDSGSVQQSACRLLPRWFRGRITAAGPLPSFTGFPI